MSWNVVSMEHRQIGEVYVLPHRYGIRPSVFGLTVPDFRSVELSLLHIPVAILFSQTSSGS